MRIQRTRGAFAARWILSAAFACATLQSTLAAGPSADEVKSVREKAVNFLKTAQLDEGGWTSATSPGVGGLVVFGLLEAGVGPDDPVVARGLRYLESFIQKDGGIYHEMTAHKNYETCICLMAFAKANTGGKYTKTIADAEKFLKGLQWDEGEGIESSDERYGGAGYGNSKRPDLSNTAFLLEALKSAGVGENDPAMKKALVFISRTQNLESEHNTTKYAAKVNDGGFYYTIAAGGSSQAGMTDDGGLRSYGSMTYAGLKSMIYAGLKQDDPRVKAAYAWIQKNYTVEENPGLGDTGIFYAYHTMAKTLTVLKLDELTDAKGVKHDWRKDIFEQLARRQNENGSWVNKAPRWMEGDPNLATAYGLMALAYVGPK